MTQHPGWILVVAGLVIAGIGIVWLIGSVDPLVWQIAG